MIVNKLFIFSVINIVVVLCARQNSQLTDESWLPAGLRGELNKARSFYKGQDWYLQIQTRFFRGKCEENSRSDTFYEAEKLLKDAHTCYESVKDRKRPELDGRQLEYTMFTIQRYCAEARKLEECYDLLMTGVRPCLTTNESRQLDSWLDARHQLFVFTCSNDGETMSRFVADGGLACIEAHQDELNECTHGLEDFLVRLVPEMVTINSIFDEVQEEQCTKVKALNDCVVATLQRCGRPTIAETANSIINILIGGTSCKDLVKPSAAVGVSGAYTLLAAAAGVTLLL